MEKSNAFCEYVFLLVALHQEMAHGGGGESALADQIRDAMDDPWNALSKEEREEIRNLSGDLYAISGEHHANRDAVLPPDWEREFAIAHERGDIRAALQLLRNGAPVADLCAEYARCYRVLNWPVVAEAFEAAAAQN